MTTDLPPTKRRFRFSLRTLLAGFLLVGLLLAVVGSRIQHGRRQNAILEGSIRLQGEVHFADERVAGGYQRANPERGWLQRWLGDGYFRTIEEVDLWASDVPEEMLLDLARLPDLKRVTIPLQAAHSRGGQRLKAARPDIDLWAPYESTVPTFRDFSEFHPAIAGEAVLFVYGDWSMTSQDTDLKFDQFTQVWKEAEPARPVKFRRLNLTDDDNELWRKAQSWMDAESLPQGTMKQHGRVGMVIWVRNGHAVDHLWTTGREEVSELLARTKKALSD